MQHWLNLHCTLAHYNNAVRQMRRPSDAGALPPIAMHQQAELNARPHGFRSTLRVWLTEKAQANNDVAEVIIAHKTGTNVERAYNRPDYLEQRRGYMKNWAEFLVST
jgi:integrase